MGLPPIDRDRVIAYWNMLVYGVCLYLLGFGFWKSVLVMPIALICVVLNYGGRWVLRGGFLLLVLTVLVVEGVVPQLSEWPGYFKQGIELIFGKPQTA